MKKHMLPFILIGVTGLIIGSINLFLPAGHSMSLLFTLFFWVSVVQGCVALPAVADAAGSDWMNPLKSTLLSAVGMMPLIAVLFGFMIPKLQFYPWFKHPTAWLNPMFFMTRNLGLIVFSFAAAWLYRKKTLSRSRNTKSFAIIYLFTFAISQTVFAVDWVMSLEYPWISTLLGAYFFVESLYLAMAVAGIYLFLLNRTISQEAFKTYHSVQRDVATLTFGFSLFWAGLLYSQYLVIWYGHLPEESEFFVRRLSQSPFKEIAVLLIPCLFVIPFIAYLTRKSKTNALIGLLVSTIIIAGIILERIFIIAPATPLNGLIIFIDFVLMTAVLSVIIRFRPSPLKDQ